ncbi:MAG TPA: dTDP-4-dehydrorhamnose 3,5-epimerase [Nitrospira sp.]|nr:dTDP-4-dehydrorhamnose 3,5-epimerase [Nitrospira sp.]
MRISRIDIPGVVVIDPTVFRDERGCFLEVYHAERYAEADLKQRFVQDNYSRSVYGTLRGLHFQEPHGQGKLVMALEGSVYDVIVDIRKGSPTFGTWYAAELSSDNLRQLYIPPGCAHGFCVISKTAAFLYKCTELYSPKDERGIRWDDPQLAIPWPVSDPILSPKDRAFRTLREIDDELPFYRP